MRRLFHLTASFLHLNIVTKSVSRKNWPYLFDFCKFNLQAWKGSHSQFGIIVKVPFRSPDAVNVQVLYSAVRDSFEGKRAQISVSKALRRQPLGLRSWPVQKLSIWSSLSLPQLRPRPRMNVSFISNSLSHHSSSSQVIVFFSHTTPAPTSSSRLPNTVKSKRIIEVQIGDLN